MLLISAKTRCCASQGPIRSLRSPPRPSLESSPAGTSSRRQQPAAPPSTPTATAPARNIRTPPQTGSSCGGTATGSAVRRIWEQFESPRRHGGECGAHVSPRTARTGRATGIGGGCGGCGGGRLRAAVGACLRASARLAVRELAAATWDGVPSPRRVELGQVGRREVSRQSTLTSSGPHAKSLTCTAISRFVLRIKCELQQVHVLK